MSTGAPIFAACPFLTFPDRCRSFERIDRKSGSLKGFRAMRCGHRCNDRTLAEFESTGAMQQRDPSHHRPTFADLSGDLCTTRLRLFLVRLVGQSGHSGAPLGVVSDRAAEHHYRPTFGTNNPVVDLADRQLTIEEAEPIFSLVRWVHNGIVAATAARRRLPRTKRHYYVSFVAQVPPPPHERTWRHPSEMASGQRSALDSERPSTTVRAVGTLSATVGFILIGLGLVLLSPDKGADTDASQVSDSGAIPLATPIDLSAEWARLLGLAPDSARRIAMASDYQVAALGAIAPPRSRSQPDGDEDPQNRLEIQREVQLEVRLLDGTVTGARMISSRSGVALIELDQPPQLPGRQLATVTPGQADEVVLLSEKPQTVTYARLTGIPDEEPLQLVGGTPVVDADGLLLGMCVEHSQGVYTHFISVNELLSFATSPVTKRP